jgi:DnaK suppressor protein
MNWTYSSFDKFVLLQFKSGLREQQRELQQSIDQSEKEIREFADSRSSNLADAAPRYSLEDSILARLSQDRRRLNLIELALERIRSGSFGACAGCGAAIGTRRLQAVPWASHCIECQQRFEQVESN